MKFKIVKHKEIIRDYDKKIWIEEWYTIKYRWFIFWFTLKESCYDDETIITFGHLDSAKDYIKEFKKLKRSIKEV